MEEPFRIEDFEQWDVSPAEDAFTYYAQAANLRSRIKTDYQQRNEEEPRNIDDVIRNGWVTADEAVVNWLGMHREAIQVWRKGTIQDRGWNSSPVRVLNQSLMGVGETHDFVRLALLEAARCRHEGRLDDAWQWCRAAYRSTAHYAFRGGYLEGSVVVPIHSIITREMAHWAEDGRVDSELFKSALKELRTDYGLYPSASSLLIGEYISERKQLMSSDWVWDFEPPFAVLKSYSKTELAIISFKHRAFGEPELSLRIRRQFLVNQLGGINPVGLGRARLLNSESMIFLRDPTIASMKGQLEPDALNRAVQSFTKNQRWIDWMRRIERGHIKQAARQAALETLLACRVYQRDSGKLPETLSQLIPDYLDEIPVDPASLAGSHLNYRRVSASQAVIWSVSIDGRDDGGDVEQRDPTDVGFVLR
jgi:hypothetical protein